MRIRLKGIDSITKRLADGTRRTPASGGGGEPRRTCAMAAAGLLEPHEFMHLLRPPRKRKPPPPNGPFTPDEAAAKLRCSIKTLKGYVKSGALRYILIGHGTKRQRKLFSDADLTAFIEAQSRKDVPCPSTRINARHTGNTISGGAVIAFSAQPRPRPGVQPKK